MWIKKHDKYNNIFLSKLCFGILCFCLLVILWGAWVRISHSGDGCGKHWPSCHGQYLLDSKEPTKTWIEWGHRATSSLLGGIIFLLSFLCFFKFSFSHPIYKTALYVLLLTLNEAFIGALLVLLGLTGNNTSFIRIVIMNLHLLNSLLLVSSLFILWRLLKGKYFSIAQSFKQKKYFFVFIFLFFVICFFGSIASLATSLFPSTTLLSGLTSDFTSQNGIIRWRILHPILAFLFAGSFILYRLFYKTKNVSPFILCIYLMLFSGLINLLFLSPVLLKLLHILFLYILTMGFILSLEHNTQKLLTLKT